ncbi:helix-turn-helix transcriptional regulator [Oricola sp.]|uniref:helix-turn-helix transcriptional regulator n=1 Tax=Oricola sp. TaxID=1979950 RepID=UPI003BAC99D2
MANVAQNTLTKIVPPQDSVSDDISRCETTYDILQLARGLAKQRGYSFFSVVRLPSADDRTLSDISLVTNWPPELVSSYDRLGLLENSPVISALRSSTRPYVWTIDSAANERPEEEASLVNELFRTFGLTSGVYLSTLDVSGRRGAVSFAGARKVPSEEELVELSYIANLIYDQVNRVKSPTKQTEQALSAREKECLIWTASGKTSADIASILKLSEHTVNHYLSSACHKLGAVNRAHAVAKALRSGLFE